MNIQIHPHRVVIYVSCLASAMTASLLAIFGPVADEASFFSYYVNLALGPVANAFFLVLLACFLGTFTYLGFYLLASAFYYHRDPREFFSRSFLIKKAKNIVREFFSVITLGGPVILTLVFVSLSMAYINPVNISRLMDNQVVTWDRFLTGGYPFVSLHTVNYPDWFVEVVDFSYINLPLFMVALSLYIFVFHKPIFEEMAGAFCFSLMLMIFFWQLIPIMSPHDRFIDNVYNLPNSPEITQALKERAPTRPVENFLTEARERKNRSLNGVMPTSTLPSAHVAWAVLIAYYGYRVYKKLLFVILPIAVFSTIGTVLFAQHYFVDIPAGIVVMAFSIWAMRLLSRTSGVAS